MAFSSLRFFVLLAATAGLYRWVPLKARNLYLAVVSYLFYFSWSVPYAALLLAATLVAYLAGLRIAAAPEKGQDQALWLALIGLIGALAFFKCFSPIASALMGERAPMLLIPLGISYYTFKLTSYVIDVYWQKQTAERDFVAFAAYAAFFPQIASGPIQRASDFLPQTPGRPSGETLVPALRLLLFGLFKKLVVADRLGPIVSQVYGAPGEYHGWPVWTAFLAFGVQLYADFSGFTDIANGAALLFGIRAPENFDAPFYSQDIPTFWRRWHMTLTSWLLDYVFTPLRMALRRYGDAGLAASVFIMLVALGAWHGLRWGYLIFGAVNGAYLAVSALTLKRRERFFAARPLLARLRPWYGPVLTYLLLSASLVFFRADTLAAARGMFAGLLRRGGAMPAISGLAPGSLLVTALAVATMEAVHAWRKRRGMAWPVEDRAQGLLTLAYYGVLSTFLLAGQPLAAMKFIYFQF